MRAPPDGLQRTCGSSFVEVAWRKLYSSRAHGWKGTSATFMLVGRFMMLLSIPLRALVAMVAPALPYQSPVWSGTTPRFYTQFSRRGVGPACSCALHRMSSYVVLMSLIICCSSYGGD